MGNNGMNVNSFHKTESIQPSGARPTETKLSDQEKIIIDFRALDRDGDLHVTIDEILRHQVDEYVRTGQLPEGKTIADFLADIQAAVEKHAGDDKQLNIDEYGAVVKSGVEMFRPSEGQVPQGSDGYAYSEWGEVDKNGNVSFGAEYSARAEANQKQIDEIADMKRQAQEKTKSEDSNVYRTDDDKARDTRARIADLEKQLQETGTPEGHTEAKKEIEFLKLVLESNGYEPYS